VRVRRACSLIGTVLGLSLALVAPAQAFDWADLWSSAEQRAARQLEKQQYDELINDAPDASWRGLGEFRKGDYSAAAKSFEQQRAQAAQDGLAPDVERATYNQANAHVLEENYQAAIDLFDELLEANPQHANASHNRDIAQQLLEQQQQEQPQDQSQQQSGDEGEQGEQNDQEKSEQNEQENQQAGQGEQSESEDSSQSEDQQQDSQQSEPSSDENAQNDETNTDESSASAQEQAAQDAAAEAAMQAEREREVGAEPAENADAAQEAESAAPLTEREQANEQWLRQIPDDPAGLLERKIQNRHMTDFPKVRDSDEPW